MYCAASRALQLCDSTINAVSYRGTSHQVRRACRVNQHEIDRGVGDGCGQIHEAC